MALARALPGQGAPTMLDLSALKFIRGETFTDEPQGKRSEPDLLAEARSSIGERKPILIHLESEREYGSAMDRRVWRYYMHLEIKYALPVVSIVVFLTGGKAGKYWCEVVETVGSFEVSRFSYLAFGLSGCLAEDYVDRPQPLAAARIFLLDGDDLRPMDEKPYDSEDLLQRLLAKHPDLLAGDQIDDDDPRRWLLVQREVGVPDRDDGDNRWSVDHLFLDQDGIPTLVEVKRSSDTRIRREVVGQLLDYAAHAVVYWPVTTIREALAARYEEEEGSTGQALADAFEIVDEEIYWQQVETNLATGRIRLVFVADKIHTELRRVVEFLNKYMRPVEVLAVEIRQFVGEGRQSLVPRVIGLTAESETKNKRGVWSTEEFLARLRRLRPVDADIAEKIMDWARRKGFVLVGGRGAKHAGIHFVVTVDGVKMKPFNIYEGYQEGYLYLPFAQMGPVFSELDQRVELCRRVNRVKGLKVSPEKQYPGVGFAKLRPKGALKQLFEALGWMVTRMRAAGGGRLESEPSPTD